MRYIFANERKAAGHRDWLPVQGALGKRQQAGLGRANVQFNQPRNEALGLNVNEVFCRRRGGADLQLTEAETEVAETIAEVWDSRFPTLGVNPRSDWSGSGLVSAWSAENRDAGSRHRNTGAASSGENSAEWIGKHDDGIGLRRRGVVGRLSAQR